MGAVSGQLQAQGEGGGAQSTAVNANVASGSWWSLRLDPRGSSSREEPPVGSSRLAFYCDRRAGLLSLLPDLVASVLLLLLPLLRLLLLLRRRLHRRRLGRRRRRLGRRLPLRRRQRRRLLTLFFLCRLKSTAQQRSSHAPQ